MSLTQRTILSGLWALLQNGGRQVVTTIVFLLLARFYLNKDDFGLVALATLFLAFLEMLVTQGLGTAIIQRKSISDAHLNAAFWANVSTAAALVSLVVLNADHIAVFLGDRRAAPILKLLSVNLISAALSHTHEAVLSRNLDFKSLAYRTLIASIGSSVIAIGIAFNGGGIWALVALQLTASLSGAIVLWLVSGWHPRITFSFGALRELFPVSYPMTGVAIVSTVNDFVDQFVIGRLLGAPSLGLYVIAQRVVKLLMTVIVQTLSNVALSSFSRLSGDLDRVRSAFLRTIRLATFFAFPVFAGLAATADLVVPLLFGSGWDEVPVVMQILCLWALIGSVNYLFGPVLISIGQSQVVLKCSLLGAVLLTALVLIGAQFGVVGVAIGVLARSVLMLMMWASQLNAHIGTTYATQLEAIGKNCLVTAIMALVVIALKMAMAGNNSALVLPILVFTGGAVYALLSLKFCSAVLCDILLIINRRTQAAE